MSKEADAETQSSEKPPKASFKPGDLVWYRVKGFPFWPAKILRPDDPARPKGDKPDCYLIRFFETKDYYYAPCKDEGTKLLPLNEHWETHSVPTSRHKHLAKAIEYAQVARTLRSEGNTPTFDDGVDDKAKSIADTPTATKTPKTPKTAPPNLTTNGDGGSTKEKKDSSKATPSSPHVSSRGRKRTATPLTNMGRDYAKKDRKESPRDGNEGKPDHSDEMDQEKGTDAVMSESGSKATGSGSAASESLKSPHRLASESSKKLKTKGKEKEKENETEKDKEKPKEKEKNKDKQKDKEKEKEKDKEKEKEKDKDKDKEKKKEKQKIQSGDPNQKPITSIFSKESPLSNPGSHDEKKRKSHKIKKSKDSPTDESPDEKPDGEQKEKKIATTPDEVLKMVGEIEGYMLETENVEKIIGALGEMMNLEYTLDILKKTGVGLMLRKLRQMENKTIRKMCKKFRKELVAVVERSVGSNAWSKDPLVHNQDAKSPDETQTLTPAQDESIAIATAATATVTTTDTTAVKKEELLAIENKEEPIPPKTSQEQNQEQEQSQTDAIENSGLVEKEQETTAQVKHETVAENKDGIEPGQATETLENGNENEKEMMKNEETAEKLQTESIAEVKEEMKQETIPTEDAEPSTSKSTDQTETKLQTEACQGETTTTTATTATTTTVETEASCVAFAPQSEQDMKEEGLPEQTTEAKDGMDVQVDSVPQAGTGSTQDSGPCQAERDGMGIEPRTESSD